MNDLELARRDKVIHQYDKVDALILWDTIKQDFPKDIPAILTIIREKELQRDR